MKIYKRSFRQDFWVYVLLLICVIGVICIMWSMISGDANYKPHFYGGIVGMILFSYLIIRHIIGWKLIVTDHEIIEKTLLKTKTIPISKIDNYIISKDTIYFWSYHPSTILLEITTDSFVDYKDFEAWTKKNFRHQQVVVK